MTILPQPKKLKLTGGRLSLARLSIVLTQSCDSRIFHAAQKLAGEIYDETDIEPKITKVLGTPSEKGKIVIDSLGKAGREGYTLTVGDGIRITGDSLAGTFYGIQTLRQMLESEGEDIPCCEIADKPDMQYRGFYHDASRGRVPNLDGVFKMIDFLAYYKQNSYQLYIEHTFAFEEYKGIYKEFGYLTPEEIMEIDDYCYENFIDFVPSVSTFGHLFRLLESNRYGHLRELDSFDDSVKIPWYPTMCHHTINATDDESIKVICSIIDQFVPLCRSKYFNICCDETFDLCNGKNAGRDKAELYVEFTLKIIDHLKSLGKTVMMWGDIVLRHPEVMDRFPDDMIMLNWHYNDDPPVETVEQFARQRFGQVVCPGTSCWNQLCENVGYAEKNITKLVGAGAKYKCFGMLNTSWGDYGAVCPMTCTLYGVVLGACMSWNGRTKAMCEKFDKAVSEHVYGDPTGETVKLIRAFGKLEDQFSWGSFISYVFNGTAFAWDKTPLPEDSKFHRGLAKQGFELAESFRRLPVQSDITSDLRLMAEGYGLMCLQLARVIDGEPDPEDGASEDWCERYTEAWCRDDKPSECAFICAVMRGKRFTWKDLLSH